MSKRRPTRFAYIELQIWGRRPILNKNMLTRIAGVLMLGVFAINVYLGLYDTNLSSLNSLHYYLNWVIAVVSLVAAGLLLSMPRSKMWVALGGILWPIVYVGSLAADVETYLCSGAPASSCWPNHTAAFEYLILNYSNIPGAKGFEWKLAPVMPIALALLFIVFVLSIYSVYSMGKKKVPKPMAPPASTTQPAKPATTDQSGKPGQSGQSGTM
ncbi:MAG: hypothetical protein ACRECH_03870 [Nitrososphaerales archaeon]